MIRITGTVISIPGIVITMPGTMITFPRNGDQIPPESAIRLVRSRQRRTPQVNRLQSGRTDDEGGELLTGEDAIAMGANSAVSAQMAERGT